MLNNRIFTLSSLLIIICSIIIYSGCDNPIVEEPTTSKTDQQKPGSTQTETSQQQADSTQVKTTQQQADSTQIIARSIPSGYLELTITPGEIYANIGDEIEVCVDIYSLVNTPVEMNSVELVLYGPEKTQLRKQIMTMDSAWSGHTSYIVEGDEAYYRLTLNFTMPYVDNKDHSEYTAEFIPISVD